MENGEIAQDGLPYEAVVLDIEGTTTPITFVHDILFPYIRNNVQQFLEAHWASPVLQEKIVALRDQAIADIDTGLNAPAILDDKHLDVSEVQASVIANVLWQMDQDRKIGPLKSLQGYMWRTAYENGEVKGALYKDVVPALNRWKKAGVDIYIYSSGSVEAQKLLFGWSEEGDLLPFFSGHFDTSIGMKVEKASYSRIAEKIGKAPERIIFVSDNIKEIAAAIEAKFLVAIAFRPGNAPLPPSPSAATAMVNERPVAVVKTFFEIFERASDITLTYRQGAFNMDDLIHLETMFEELGHEDGLRDGIQSGHLEGRLAGVEHGFNLALEAGYYSGLAESWLKAADKGLIALSDRQRKSLTALQSIAASFPMSNMYTESDSGDAEDIGGDGNDPMAMLQRARARFKVVRSAMGGLLGDQQFSSEKKSRGLNF
ncbi:Enolase-phosphatase E1 [Gaertneriomyces sp. JEL0708]|nr:Enolase-phosphatase E1 [Gaertneriomyces sp. JEL0708]